MEDAFELVAEVPERVVTALWVGDCFVYSNAGGRLNYCVGGEARSPARPPALAPARPPLSLAVAPLALGRLLLFFPSFPPSNPKSPSPQSTPKPPPNPKP